MILELDKKNIVVVEDDPAVIALHDLSVGEVRKKDTSYLGSQNEVTDMIKATKSDRWPGFWYELLQGAWDYNDWKKGPPEIKVVFANGEEISLARYVQENSIVGTLQKLKRGKVREVRVSNFIRGEAGLRPVNMVLTDHDEKDGQKTLGAHGRGFKIASTSVFAGKLAKGISYESWVPELGRWYGEAGMHTDDDDPKAPANFGIKYKRDKALQFDRTIVRVAEPSSELLEALIAFQDWFLPVNGRYRFQRMEAEAVDVLPNKATIFASEKNVQQPNDAAIPPRELSWRYGQEGLENANGIEPPRIEILSRELLPNQKKEIDFVFIDGLRVAVPGAVFCQVYAFWGWGKGDYGYNPGRSNDSLKLTGSIENILAATLALTTNENVFYEILSANLDGKKTYEGSDISAYLLDELAKNSGPKAALISAWERLRLNLKAPEGLYITSYQSDHQRAKREKKPTILISNPWADLLCKVVPGLTKVSDIFAKEYEIERAKARAAEEALAVERAEAAAKIAREREAAVAEFRRTTGIIKEAESTGEVIKMGTPENRHVSLQLALLHLVHAVSMDGGRIVSSDPSKLVFEMRADGFNQLPSNTNALETLGEFLKMYLVVFGGEAIAQLKIVKAHKGVYFNFARSKAPDNFHNYSIEVKQGDLELAHESWIQIELSLPDSKKVYSQDRPIRKAMIEDGDDEIDVLTYHQVLVQAIQTVCGVDGKADRNAYLESEYYELYPPAAARLKMRMAIEETQLEMRRLIDERNKLRVAAGLKPIPYPDELVVARPKKPGIGAGMGLAAPQELDAEGQAKVAEENHKESALKKQRRKIANILKGQDIIDDVQVESELLSMIHPDSVPGLSVDGKVKRTQMIMAELPIGERMRAKLAEKMAEILNRVAVPDFSLSSGEWLHLRGYLIDHINPSHSITSTDQYDVLPMLPFAEMPTNPCLRFNKMLVPGFYSLPCPPGFHPVAVTHPNGPNLGIRLTGNLEKNVFAVRFENEIPPGLSFYFEPTKNPDRTPPDQREIEVTADESGLAEHWFNLISEIRNSSLTDKQKVDVIIRAWTKAFNYSDQQEAFDQYLDSRGIYKKFTTDIINKSIGNCGYATQGILGLLTLIGIPTRDVAAFLHDGNGNFSRRSNYHGMVQVYLDKQWVLIEPQSGYVQEGYQTEELPSDVRVSFENLLADIPRKYLESPRMAATLPDVLGGEPEEIPTIRQSIKESLLALLPFRVAQFGNPLNSLRDVWTAMRQRNQSAEDNVDQTGAEASVTKILSKLDALVKSVALSQLPSEEDDAGGTGELATPEDVAQEINERLKSLLAEQVLEVDANADLAQQYEQVRAQLTHYTELLQLLRLAESHNLIKYEEVMAMLEIVNQLADFSTAMQSKLENKQDQEMRLEIKRAKLRKALVRLSAAATGATLGIIIAPHMGEILQFGATQFAAAKELVETYVSVSSPNLPPPEEIIGEAQKIAQKEVDQINNAPQPSTVSRQYWILAMSLVFLASTHTGAYLLGVSRKKE